MAEVDGAVRQAIWDDYASSTSNPFWFQAAGVAGGKSAWSVFDTSAQPRSYLGLGGDDRALKPATLFGPGAEHGVPRPGAHFYAEAGEAISILDYEGRDYGVLVPDAGDAAVPAWAGDLFFTTLTANGSAVQIWSKASGPKQLLSSQGREGHGIGSFATDGVDMVWLEGTTNPQSPDQFSTVDVFRAKASVDPKALAPLRVRAFPGQQIWSPFAPAVGCGYAAFNLVMSAKGTAVSHLFIVKLADGSAWDLRPPDETNVRYNWGPPAAITCDEVFVPMADNLRRVRLDSLGSPLPAE